MVETRKYKIIDVSIDVLTRAQFIEKIDTRIAESKKTIIFTPYSEFIYKAHIDETFRNILNSADINIADGVFVQIASLYYETVKKSSNSVINYIKILSLIIRMILRKIDRTIIFPELLSGSNEIKTLCKLAEEKNYSIYMIGGEQNVVYNAAQSLLKEFPGLKVVGKQVGKAFSSDDKKLLQDIKAKKPDMLFVCYGGQKQERWINYFKDQLNAKVIIGLGGTFDYVSGKRKLQSKWWSDRGLNWLHRLISEPVRWRRQIVIFKLLWILAKSK